MSSEPGDENKTAKPHIWFKVTYSLATMFPTSEPENPVVISLPDDQEISFWMRTFPPEKHIPAQLCCSAIAKRSINDKLNEHFVKFSKRVLPIDSSSKVTLPHTLFHDARIDKDGNIPENCGVGLGLFPNNFQDIQREMNSKLHDLIESYIKTLRWVQRASGKQAPLAFVSFEYSFDRQNWHSMPNNSYVTVHSPKPIKLKALDSVTELWTQNKFEPLAHELLREAFDVLRSNPRSALLIGSTALETGLKHFIDFLLPNAGILLEKMPSPPPLTMIRDVIPEIQKQLGKPEISLQKDELELLQKWNTVRNKVAHGMPQEVKPKDLEEFLNFVQKLLYHLDQHRGHAWAASFSR
jgi:hypothetical protein